MSSQLVGNLVDIGMLIVAITSVLVTISIYYHNKFMEKQRAIIEVVMLIESIINGIRIIRSSIKEDGKFDIEIIWLSEELYGLNKWEELKVFFMKDLTKEQIKSLNFFFEYAHIISKQQNEIKANIADSYKQFYLKKILANLDNATVPHIRVATLYTKSIIKSYEEILLIYTKLPLERLNKIARLKNFNM